MGRAKIARTSIGENRTVGGRLLSVIAALAIAFQCIVVQSHVHRESEQVAASYVVDMGELARPVAIRGHDQAKKQPSGRGAPTSCFICQQMTVAGAMVLPTNAAPLVIELNSFVVKAMFDAAVVEMAASHNWRSRAPPVLPSS